jgi:hypothetical protein
MRDPLGGVDHRLQESLDVSSSGLGTIRIERARQYANRLRRITIWVDGEQVGQISDGEGADFAVEPGPHRVRATIDWCKSETLSVNLDPGRRITLHLSSPVRPWRLFGALSAVFGPPGSFIALAPLEPQPEASEPAV